MRLKLSLLVLCLTLLGGCRAVAPSPTAEVGATPSPTAQIQTSVPAAAAATPAADNAASTRAVVVSEVEKDVLHYPQPEADNAEPLYGGERLDLQGAVETGEESRARLDVLPEATIIRLGPSTRLQLTSLSPNEAQTGLQLFFGQLWIILNGGQLEVETETGSASVRGSMMSVSFDPQSGRTTVTCLEGHCRLANAYGSVDLTAGQAAEIPGPGQPPGAPRPMTPEEVHRWLKEVPETNRPPSADGLPVTTGVTPTFVFDYTCPGKTPLPGPVTVEIKGDDGFSYHASLNPGDRLEVEVKAGVLYLTTVSFGDGGSYSAQDLLESYSLGVEYELCYSD